MYPAKRRNVTPTSICTGYVLLVPTISILKHFIKTGLFICTLWSFFHVTVYYLVLNNDSGEFASQLMIQHVVQIHHRLGHTAVL